MANVIIPVQKIANLVTTISSSSTNTQYPSALCVFNSIEGAKGAIGIPEFQTTATYAAGKLVLHGNAIWKSKSAISAGNWNASNWDMILGLGETNSRFPNAVTVGSRASGTYGAYSFAAGSNTIASGEASVAEGTGTTASGGYSHAEGYGSTASGVESHAEGESCSASGMTAHAEGYSTSSSGLGSHSEGVGSTSQNMAEHAQGKFNATHNASDTFGAAGNTLSSIGFGTANNARKNAVETMQDGKTYVYNLGGYDGTNPTGSGVKDIATAINDKAEAVDLRYAVVTKTPTVSSGTASLSLDDRACNSASTTAATVSLTFPAVINGRARDFLLLLDTTGSSSAPTLAYASYMSIVADEDADLTPIVGQNLYTFTEIARNTFVATRTTLTTIAEQVPQDGQGVLSAASQAGYDMTNVNTPGQLATALGLTNSADFEDCANKVMFG